MMVKEKELLTVNGTLQKVLQGKRNMGTKEYLG